MLELEDRSILRHMPVPPEQGCLKEPQNGLNETEAVSSATGVSVSDAGLQLSLFPEEPSYVKELRSLKTDTMTPLEALNYLDALIDRVRRGHI